MDGENGPLTRYAKFRVAHAPGMPGTLIPPPTSKKPPVSDPVMHHGTCVTHVPWCMPGLLTRGGGENVPGIPGACAKLNFAYLCLPQPRKVAVMSLGISLLIQFGADVPVMPLTAHHVGNRLYDSQILCYSPEETFGWHAEDLNH